MVNSALVIVDGLHIVLVVVLVVQHVVLLPLMVEVLLEVRGLVAVVAAAVVSILTVCHVVAVLSWLGLVGIVFMGVGEDCPVRFLLGLRDIVMLYDHWFGFVVHWGRSLHVRHVVVRCTRRRHRSVLDGRLVVWRGHLGVRGNVSMGHSV